MTYKNCNITRLFKGIWILFWILFSTIVTGPIWMLLLAYDLANPQDHVDRVGNWLIKIYTIGGLKL